MAKRKRRNNDGAVVAKAAPTWADMSLAKKREITHKLLSAYIRVGRFAAGRYNVVSSKYTSLREPPQIETTGEDSILTATLRNQFIDLARNGVRNNETLCALLKQFEVNVVGNDGGKAYFDFGPGYEDAEKTMTEMFSRFCEAADFYDGCRLNEVLSISLKTLLLGGGMVLLMDNGVTDEDCGRIMEFEPDCVANLKEGIFKRKFPGWSQSNGRIRNANGRWCGVVVSHAERGKSEFEDLGKCYVLNCDPNGRALDRDWTYVSLRWRFNQGGGKSPLTAGLGSLIDVQMLQGFEIESAKKNAQTLAQLYQTNKESDNIDPSLMNPAANADVMFDDNMSEEEVEAAVEDATAFETPSVTFDEMRSAGCIYEVMPENSKLELLDTKHPNPNMNEFIRLVACRGGWSLGVSSVYTTGKVDNSYTGFRGEQLMSWPMFEKWQKFLEQEVCDWVLARWFAWTSERGLFPADLKLPENWQRCVRWFWPKMREVNPMDEQNAVNAGLKNGTRTYLQVLGPNYKETLRQRAREKDFMREIGLPDPAMETVSGQILDQGGSN